MEITEMTETPDRMQYLKQEIERLLSTQEYNAAIKNITDEDRILLPKIIEVLEDRTSSDAGLTLSQLAQQVNEHGIYRIQRVLQLIKYMTLMQLMQLLQIAV